MSNKSPEVQAAMAKFAEEYDNAVGKRSTVLRQASNPRKREEAEEVFRKERAAILGRFAQAVNSTTPPTTV